MYRFLIYSKLHIYGFVFVHLLYLLFSECFEKQQDSSSHAPEADKQDGVQQLAVSKALGGYTLAAGKWVGIPSLKLTVCWLKKSCTTRDAKNLVNNGIFTISTGEECVHQQ